MTSRALGNHLRAVPAEGESVNNFIKQQEETFNVITGWFEEAHELAAAKRTIKKHQARAKRAGATDRAAYFETALESIEEGMRTDT